MSSSAEDRPSALDEPLNGLDPAGIVGQRLLLVISDGLRAHGD